MPSIRYTPHPDYFADIRELVDLLEDPVARKKTASVADAAGSDESDDNTDLALQWDLGTGAPCWNSGPDLFLGEL